MVRWEDVREDLLDAMLQVSMPLTRDQQESIVAILNERGHNVTWNAMRYVRGATEGPLSSLIFP